MKVAYLGPKGSFTHSATKKQYSQAELISYPTIPACIEAVNEGLVALGVVPIENTIEGTVNPTLDYLYHKVALNVVAELVLPITQHLLLKATEQTELKKITKVYSHPQALAQCQEFLAAFLPQAQLVATDSTSLAAKYVAETEEEGVAAIASLSCAEEYNLALKKSAIQDIVYNQTRFWVISQEESDLWQQPVTEIKLSLCLLMPNNLPGALQKALTTFSWRELNLSKIESRPLKTTLGEYFFLADLVMPKAKLPLVKNAVEEIHYLGGTVKTLGMYPVFELKSL